MSPEPATYACPIGYSCNLQVGAVWQPEPVMALVFGVTALICITVILYTLLNRRK